MEDGTLEKQPFGMDGGRPEKRTPETDGDGLENRVPDTDGRRSEKPAPAVRARFRPGLSSYAFTWAVGVPGSMPEVPLSAFELFERTVRNALGVLQIADNCPLHLLSQQELERLADTSHEFGVTIEPGTRGLREDILSTYLPIAQRLGAPVLRVVPDLDRYRPSADDLVRLLRQVTGRFEDAGIVLAVENHDRFTAETLVRIMEEVDSRWVGICLDTVNSLGACDGIRETVRLLAPFTVNLHVKDFRIFRPFHSMGFTVEGVPAGQGMLDLPWLLSELAARSSYPSPISAILEQWTPPVTVSDNGRLRIDIDATVARERHWANESVRYLKESLS